LILNDSQHLASIDQPDDFPREPAPPVPAPGAEERAGPPPTNWWAELRAIFWLVLAVIAFHSLIAKPFYIPSESMMPGLLKGDRLVVSKYPYGWSWVSPSFHFLPHWQGRLWGAMPERGDVVIVTPPGDTSDYIKRVIGLPGDRIQLVGGQLYINGEAVRQERRSDLLLPIDANIECRPEMVTTGEGDRPMCRLPIVRETLPNGRAYDTIDSGYYPESDDFGPVVVPAGHVFLMGDNRDQSADSRFPLGAPTNGLGGAVPWENIGGRAEFITFSLDGSSQYWNPISWFTALRGGRSGMSLHPDEVEPSQERPAS
jgi:signal peptidase I